MRRIVVTGARGSGKSSFALELGRILDIRVFHLDSLFWRPGWIPCSPEERRSVLADIVRKEKWIIEGHADYKCANGTYEIRLATADTVVFLDLPQWLCLWRILKRKLQKF